MLILVIGLSVGLSKSSNTTNTSILTYMSVEMNNFGVLMLQARLLDRCDNIIEKDRSNFENSIKDNLASINTIGSFINKNSINIIYSCR